MSSITCVRCSKSRDPMQTRKLALIILSLTTVGLLLSACGSPNPQPAALTPIPTLAPGVTLTLAPALQGSLQGSAGNAAPASGEGVAAEGAATYLQNCSPCHGDQGQGIDAPALRNNQYVQSGDSQDIFNTVANGRPDTEMPAWLQDNGGPLVQSQIQNVIAYLHTLQGVESLPTATPQPPEPTEEPLAPGAATPEPAQPSNPGNPGPALNLTGDAGNGRAEFGLYCARCHGPQGVQGIPNPGSEDESVPALNPIDPTIVNPAPQIFAENVDQFIEHGSVPEGTGPMIVMPSFGDSQMLTPQQIADLIAYVIQLNQGQ
jgi:mono/diheme cytochrome c family protein